MSWYLGFLMVCAVFLFVMFRKATCRHRATIKQYRHGGVEDAD